MLSILIQRIARKYEFPKCFQSEFRNANNSFVFPSMLGATISEIMTTIISKLLAIIMCQHGVNFNCTKRWEPYFLEMLTVIVFQNACELLMNSISKFRILIVALGTDQNYIVIPGAAHNNDDDHNPRDLPKRLFLLT